MNNAVTRSLRKNFTKYFDRYAAFFSATVFLFYFEIIALGIILDIYREKYFAWFEKKFLRLACSREKVTLRTFKCIFMFRKFGSLQFR